MNEKVCPICSSIFTRKQKGCNLINTKTCSRSCGVELFIRNKKSISNEYKKINETTTQLIIGDVITLIDNEDIEILQPYTWCMDSKGYVYRHTRKNEKGSALRLHRVLMNPPKDMTIDHINRIRTDNRKENLRIVTQSTNLLNRSTSKRNTSGITGVDVKKYGYRARITIRGKDFNKLFHSYDEAVTQRKLWEKELI